jgi:hypothetical protein
MAVCNLETIVRYVAILFELKEFLCDSYQRSEIIFREFQKLICGSAPPIIKLARLWNAGIDDAGFLATWAWLAFPDNYPQGDLKAE